MKTWHYELLVVTGILCLTTLLFQNNRINWITTVAIMFTFQHAQIGDRLQEGQRQMTNPDVKCFWKLNILFAMKEIVWIATFLLMHNYAAIVGSIMFACYPVWRKIYRSYRPRRDVKDVMDKHLLSEFESSMSLQEKIGLNGVKN